MMGIPRRLAVGSALALAFAVQATGVKSAIAQSKYDGVPDAGKDLYYRQQMLDAARSHGDQAGQASSGDALGDAIGGIIVGTFICWYFGCFDDTKKVTEPTARTAEPPPTPPRLRSYEEPSWRVEGGLKMRLRPSLGAPKTGEIPPQSGGIRRGQCVQEEWTWKGAVDANGESNNARVWCEAMFESQTGWVSAKYLLRE